MKIVLYTAGLGNQIFQLFFTLWLQKKYPKEKIYGCYDKAILANHNGLEVQKVFDVELPPTNRLVYIIERLIRAIFKRTRCNFFSSHGEADKDTLYYEGYWHDKRFFEDCVGYLKFREDIIISNQNTAVLQRIKSSNSVSIHVRRGDYLKPEFEANFAHSCPLEYYQKAIEYTIEKIPDVNFFVFSDDIEWVRTNINISNATFVDWNKGPNSFWDMRLMSECSASIIANSSFSFWGAILGKPKLFVIKPRKWIGNEIPPIFPKEWISF